MSGEAKHWERIYSERAPDEVSWYEPMPQSSLAMIEGLELDPEDPIIDVGGGTSSLAAELIARGYRDVTVADISKTALESARASHPEPDRVQWVVADLRDHDFDRRFGLWHDRAVFHFMTDPEDRRGYARTLERSLRPDGHVIVATFGPDGPTRCSGLPVVRYGARELQDALGGRADLVNSHLEEHRTPSGAEQQFLFAHLRARRAA